MAEFAFRVLHISDLHASPSDAWRRERVLGEAWDKNLDELRAEGDFDLVCFTGDVATAGAAPEYDLATRFVDELLARVGLPRERFFVVPGNHDVERGVERERWARVRAQLGDCEATRVARWAAGQGALPGFVEGDLAALLSRQMQYRRWVREGLGRAALDPAASPHGQLGYRATLSLPGRPFDVHVLGLDSAWLCGDDNDAGKLRLTDAQIGRLATDAEGRPLRGFRLALLHHGLDELADAGRSRALLAEYADLVLRGHFHEAAAVEWANPDRRLRQLVAGCLYESDRYPNACQAIRVTTDGDGRPLRYDVRFRAWSTEGGFWYDDGGLYRQAEHGRLRWSVDGGSAAHAPTPGDTRGSWAAAAAERFVGRGGELLEIERHLLAGEGAARPVAICALRGMPGVGKSFLADRFAQLHGVRFPGGYERLVLDPQAPAPARADLLRTLADRWTLSVSAARLAEGVRARLLNPPTLLHVENVDSRPAAALAAELAAALPGCALLFSGRFQDLGAAAAWGRVEVRPFDAGDALAQLEAELQDTPREPKSEYERLVGALGGLPLALHLAAGHLRAGLRVAAFLQRLWATGLALEPVDPADPALLADRTRALLSRTFELSLELLRAQLGDEAERAEGALRALACGPPAGVGAELGAALAGLEVGVFEHLTSATRGLSLVEALPRAGGGWSWRLHPLLAELLRRGAGTAGAATTFERLTAWFLERLPERSAERGDEQGQAWTAVHAETESLRWWLERVPAGDQPRVARAADLIADVSQMRGDWAEALRIRRAYELPVYERLGDAPARATCLGKIADVLEACGKVDEALRIRREEQPQLYAHLNDMRSNTVSMGKIAGVRQARKRRVHGARMRGWEPPPMHKRPDEAGVISLAQPADMQRARAELAENALRILHDEELLSHERLGDVRSRAVTLGQIADVLTARGELDEALNTYRALLPMFERLGDVRARAVCLGKIADVLQARGELDEALRIRREEELPVYERLGDVRSRAITLGQIADVLAVRGEVDEALRIHREEELPVYERLGDVRSRALCLGKIADVLQARGELDEALRIRREEELPVYERLGDVRSRAVCLGKIADVLQARGELDEALRIRREEELPVYERLGDVRSRAITLGQIADVLAVRGEVDEALRIRREEELPVYERIADVRSRASTLGKIADVLQARGELDEALRIRREEELPVYERLGDVRSRAVCLGKIADVLQARGELDEALRIRREEQLPVYERLGDVRERAIALGKIADVLQARGELDEALRIRREEELPVYERLGDVRSRLVAQANLALTLLARGQTGDRAEAGRLLALALVDARRLRLPEAVRIEEIQREHDLHE